MRVRFIGAVLVLLFGATGVGAQPVNVFVDPSAQAASLGSPVTVSVRLNTNALSVVGGGVFVQFDESRLAFVNGTLNTAAWDNAFLNAVPTEAQPGIVSFSVGTSGAVTGGRALVATLNFTASAVGDAALTFLQVSGVAGDGIFRPELPAAADHRDPWWH